MQFKTQGEHANSSNAFLRRDTMMLAVIRRASFHREIAHARRTSSLFLYGITSRGIIAEDSHDVRFPGATKFEFLRSTKFALPSVRFESVPFLVSRANHCAGISLNWKKKLKEKRKGKVGLYIGTETIMLRSWPKLSRGPQNYSEMFVPQRNAHRWRVGFETAARVLRTINMNYGKHQRTHRKGIIRGSRVFEGSRA